VFAERIVPAIHELVPGLILTVLWKRWDLALPSAAGQTDAMPDIFQFGHTDAVTLLPERVATDLTTLWAAWGAGTDFIPGFPGGELVAGRLGRHPHVLRADDDLLAS
jgi:hypothetical protein